MVVSPSELAAQAVLDASPEACRRINQFCRDVLSTRGGRIGSGMGLLLEAMWGYQVNCVLRERGITFCELGWFPSHQYHDFACVETTRGWNHVTAEGEFFRVEAKSMNSGADESKAHFDVLREEVDPDDQLLLLVWSWMRLDDYHSCPQITDSFIGRAIPIIELRDVLHLARGGSFVESGNCPDGCDIVDCTHVGEPLNAQGKRERLTGPETCRPSEKVSFASNFGGLIRMLKTRNQEARGLFRDLIRNEDSARDYVRFIHKHYPGEEQNQYTVAEWRQVGQIAEIPGAYKLSKAAIQQKLRESDADYQDLLLEL